MGEVSLDDIQLALVPVSKKSASVYKSVVILYKSIFRAAMESRIIDHNPTIYLTTKGGGVPQEDRQALTDEQAERLLDAIRDLPPYVFVIIAMQTFTKEIKRHLKCDRKDKRINGKKKIIFVR